MINSQLFYIIVRRGALPIYILSEVIDNLTRLGKSIVSLYKWRQFIHKLKALKDVESNEEHQLQCCICLGEIVKGKQLTCNHVFHMGCLRTWLIEKAECPTCRKPIRLDKQGSEERVNRRRNRVAVEQRLHERRQRNIARAALGLPVEARDVPEPQNEEEAKAGGDEEVKE